MSIASRALAKKVSRSGSREVYSLAHFMANRKTGEQAANRVSKLYQIAAKRMEAMDRIDKLALTPEVKKLAETYADDVRYNLTSDLASLAYPLRMSIITPAEGFAKARAILKAHRVTVRESGRLIRLYKSFEAMLNRFAKG